MFWTGFKRGFLEVWELAGTIVFLLFAALILWAMWETAHAIWGG